MNLLIQPKSGVVELKALNIHCFCVLKFGPCRMNRFIILDERIEDKVVFYNFILIDIVACTFSGWTELALEVTSIYTKVWIEWMFSWSSQAFVEFKSLTPINT